MDADSELYFTTSQFCIPHSHFYIDMPNSQTLGPVPGHMAFCHFKFKRNQKLQQQQQQQQQQQK